MTDPLDHIDIEYAAEFGAHADPAWLHQQLTDALLDLALANAALERVARTSEKRLAWCWVLAFGLAGCGAAMFWMLWFMGRM